MQKLVAEAISADAERLDPDMLDIHLWLSRSATQIGITATAARSGKKIARQRRAYMAESWALSACSQSTTLPSHATARPA